MSYFIILISENKKVQLTHFLQDRAWEMIAEID